MAGHVMLRVAQYCMTFVGIWPVRAKGLKLYLYKMYHGISYGFFNIFALSMVIKFIEVIGKDFSETAGILSVAIVLFLGSTKVRICTLPVVEHLLQQIEESEREIIENTENSISAIHRKHVKMATRESLAQLVVGVSAISFYSAGPALTNKYEGRTGDDRILIYSSWFPFDQYEHYNMAYFIQCMAGMYAAGYTVSTAMCLFNAMLFGRCEIQLLQHVFRNFKYYVDKHAKEKGATDLESQKAVLEMCISRHQRIIKFINSLRDAFKTILLLDFTVTSFQFSMVVIQMFQKSEFDVSMIGMILFICTLALQLYLVYTNAHEIIIQSSDIAQAVFDSNWYDLPHDVKKDLIVVILRAQRPLYLSLGPLYEIRCDMLLRILQALYSYICIFLK